ncbi:MAG: hypothetical protein KBT48_05755 [Firmicutes bacterium]|nr:hypothetical protein [Bacillota bacterium]
MSREDFLAAAILIKYGMIPFYCFGSLINLLLVLTIIIPLPFMLFLTGSGVLAAWIIGWFLMVGSAPFALVYIFKTKEEGSVPKSLCILSAICQFILLTDVITIMAMCFKDKKFVKTTLGVLIGSILLIGLIFIGLINYAV